LRASPQGDAGHRFAAVSQVRRLRLTGRLFLVGHLGHEHVAFGESLGPLLNETVGFLASSIQRERGGGDFGIWIATTRSLPLAPTG
jgi:hypothetical protein